MVITLLDIDQIKTFIYAAPVLRAIRGSSSMLADFNDPEGLNGVKRRLQQTGGTFIYAGGGSVLARFDSKPQATAFIKSEKQKLNAATHGGATLTGVIEEVSSNGFGATVLQAQWKLNQAKARRATTTQWPHHFLLKPCQACAARPAEKRNAHRAQLVCTTCDGRIQRGGEGRTNRQRLLRTFVSEVGAAWEEAELAADLEALAASSRDYIGVIQADGNAMGERIRRLAELGDEKLFTDFSTECREATENTLLKALRSAYPSSRRMREHGIFPFELVIVGGDDVTIITTADRAIQIALDFCDGFTTQMRAFAKQCGHSDLAVAMSAGVVFAHSSHPMVLLDDLAGQLLKSAKARSRQLGDDSLTPTIDFMVVTASSTNDVKTVRTEEYRRGGVGDQRLTQRPYTTTDLRKLLSAIRKMKYPDGDAQPFPRNKLQDLYEIPFNLPMQAELEYLFLRSRLADSEQKPHRLMLRKLAEAGGMTAKGMDGPWRHIEFGPTAPEGAPFDDTNLVDAVELYDFVSKP